MALDPEIHKSMKKLIEIERQRARIELLEELLAKTNSPIYQRGNDFPFDLAESGIRSLLSLAKRTIRRGVDGVFDALDRWR